MHTLPLEIFMHIYIIKILLQMTEFRQLNI